MKLLISILLTASAVIPYSAFSSEIPENLPYNLEVTSQDNELVSFKNLSDHNLTIDIYGEEIQLDEASGAIFNCTGYGYIEIQFKDTIHDYFEVPCKSSITIKN